MNCATHNNVAAVAYCRTCGKPLCANCVRDVRGTMFCEPVWPNAWPVLFPLPLLRLAARAQRALLPLMWNACPARAWPPCSVSSPGWAPCTTGNS